MFIFQLPTVKLVEVLASRMRLPVPLYNFRFWA